MPLNSRNRCPYVAVQSVDLRMLLVATLAIVMPPAIGEPVRVVGDPGAPVAAHEAGLDNRLQRLGTVAPDRVHLEVAAVPRSGGCAGTRQDLLHGGATEKVLPQPAQRGHRLFLPRLADRLRHRARTSPSWINSRAMRSVVGPMPGIARNVFASTSGVMCRSSRNTALAARLYPQAR